MGESGVRAFVCGHPIAHSRSPLIHGYWLEQYEIPGSYSALDIAPDNFPAFLRNFSTTGFVGGNVTIPHKEAAFAFTGNHDEAAEAIGAVNTVWIEDGQIWGANTDAYGFAANLDDHALDWDHLRSSLVLGAGGASRAVVHALKGRGIGDVRITNRTASRAHKLAHRFGPGVSGHAWNALPELLQDADLVVNTTSLGMAEESGVSPVDLSRLSEAAVVCDIVYIPVETPLLKAARARGLKTVDGLGMLLHQAAPGFARWFGKQPDVTRELRELVIADMEKQH
jgi:shikimate dehydrogenase